MDKSSKFKNAERLKKQSLIVSIPSVWSLRNFIYTDVVNSLSEDYEIVLLVPSNSKIEEVAKNNNFNTISYSVSMSNTFQKIILKSLTNKLLREKTQLKKSKLIQLSFGKTLGLYGFSMKIIQSVFSFLPSDLLLKMYVKNIKIFFYENIMSLDSEETFFFATNFVVKHEMDMFLALKNRNYKLINFVNSFDNTTSRGYIPFSIFDHHIVWNKQMKEELIDIFKIRTDSIELLGTPQFELLREGADKALEDTDDLFNIVENQKYILYCAGHYSLCPFEVKMVKEITDEFYVVWKDIKFIVRLHPLDNYKRWDTGDYFSKNIIFDTPWIQNSDNPLLSVPNKYEYLRHGRILNNALAILNVGSTTSLDACVLDKPIYNLYFEDYNTNGELDLIYCSEHFTPIIESGAAPLVKDIEQLSSIINSLLSGKFDKELSQKRTKFAEFYCGYNTEKSFLTKFKNYLLNFGS